MTDMNKNMLDAYANMLSNLSKTNKLKLIERLSTSLESDENEKDERFYSSFGAFLDDKSAEEIVYEIKNSRKFRTKDLASDG
jgi:hypothetical protein